MLKPLLKDANKAANAAFWATGSQFNDKQEKNWGLAGGIAEGIAGVGAGVAAAADTIEQNERIREWNEATRSARMEQKKQFMQQRDSILGNAGRLERLNANAEVAVTSDILSSAEAEKYYSVQIENAKITSGLSLSLTAKVRGTDSDMSVKGRPAVLDGTLKLDVIREGDVIDSCLLVLPLEGLERQEEKSIEGLCVSYGFQLGDTEDLTYQVSPLHLWLIEAY